MPKDELTTPSTDIEHETPHRLPCKHQPGQKVKVSGRDGAIDSVRFRGVIGTGRCKVTYGVLFDGEVVALEEVESDDVVSE